MKRRQFIKSTLGSFLGFQLTMFPCQSFAIGLNKTNFNSYELNLSDLGDRAYFYLEILYSIKQLILASDFCSVDNEDLYEMFGDNDVVNISCLSTPCPNAIDFKCLDEIIRDAKKAVLLIYGDKTLTVKKSNEIAYRVSENLGPNADCIYLFGTENEGKTEIAVITSVSPSDSVST
jgi:hypothetical protein